MVEPQQAGAQANVPTQADALPLAPQTFEDFFRASFREVVATAMIAGAEPEEAKDAASKALLEMYLKWPIPGNPLAYARKAAFTNFIKAKERGDGRTARRLIHGGHVPRQEGAEDARLTAWEDEQWIADALSVLPQEQRQVMERIARGLTREEIAGELGKSRDLVRRLICDARPRLAEFLHPDGEPRQLNPKMARSPREEAR